MRPGEVVDLTGDYPAAAASSLQALTLASNSSDRFAEALALVNLGADS